MSRARQCAARPHKPSTSGPAPEPATKLRRGHVGESGRPRELVTLEIAGSNPVVSAIFVREDLEHERQCARFVSERLWVQVPSGPPEAVDVKFKRLNARLVSAKLSVRFRPRPPLRFTG